MSTRANIVVKDGDEKIFLYRHSDGYPKGAVPLLNRFMVWLISEKIRNNVSQSAGWLVVLGAIEYYRIPQFKSEPTGHKDNRYGKMETVEEPKDWKVGAIEITTGIHGDIAYLYVIDLADKSLKCFDEWDKDGNGVSEVDISKEIIASA